MTEQLKKKGPEHFDARTLFDEDRKEGQYPTQQYEQALTMGVIYRERRPNSCNPVSPSMCSGQLHTLHQRSPVGLNHRPSRCANMAPGNREEASDGVQAGRTDELVPLSNYPRALRRNRTAWPSTAWLSFALAVAFLLTAELIDWRNRWSPGAVPIR